MTSPDEQREKHVLENVRLAAGDGASPGALLAVALASANVSTLDDGIELLIRLRSELGRIEHETPRPHGQLAQLEPELRFDPDVAAMRLEQEDHELRGRLLFANLAGNKSFLQTAALAIAGVELGATDARLLDEIGVVTQLADPRIWPLTVTRRISTDGGSLADAVIGGFASLCTPLMTGPPVAGFMNLLERVETRLEVGESLANVVAALLKSGERLSGVGRPVLRGDERVEPMLEAAARASRDNGTNLRLALDMDAELSSQKGLSVNSAGIQGAILRDLGFAPHAAAAFSMLYFIVPLLTHAAYPIEVAARETVC